MPEFQRKHVPFYCRGMNINRPIDQIPDGEFRYLQNVRSYVAGRVEGRSPIALVTNDFVSGGAGTDYIHSICTINDLNPDSAPTPASARAFGYSNELWFSDSGAGAHTATQNTGWGTSGSGNPQSMLVASPVDSPVPWLYVYDSGAQYKFTMRYLAGAMDPYANQIGLPLSWLIGAAYEWFVPGTATLAAGTGTGTYYYRYQVRDPNTGVVCQAEPPSGYPAAEIGAASIYGHVTLASQDPTFTPPTLTTASGASYLLDVYRYGGTVNDWRHIMTVPADGTTWTDTISDAVALVSPKLDETRFQPWISEDIPRSTTCTIAAAVAGTGVGDGNGSTLTKTAGDAWNTNWLPGTEIIVNDSIVCTLRRFVTATVLEVVEDLGALGAGQTAKVIGALESGKPLPHVWGPYGSGETGIYYFACGDLQRPGTLCWTTGNDPDSTKLTYTLDITDASDPLQNGCIYNGRAYVWSTKAMYEIIPDPYNPGQFLAQIIPGSKGLWAPWGLAVGDVIYFWSKDGIYSTTGAGAPRNLTDDQLYPLFEHENVPGQNVVIQNPENFGAPINLYPPEPSKINTWRLTYGDGTLYADYVEDTSGLPRTLVYCKFPLADGAVAHGWVMDVYNVTAGYVNRYFEVVPSTTQPGGSMLLAVGQSVFEWASGVLGDAGSAITCRIQSGALDLGDNRANKLIGDQMVDANPNGLTVTARILGANNTSELSTAGPTLTTAAPRTQNVIDINSGLGTQSRTVGLWLTWSQATGAVAEVYQWSTSYVQKPTTTKKQATDWSNDGKPCAKWLMGCIIEANVSTDARTDLAVDAANNKKVTSATVHGTGNFVAADVGSVLQVTAGTNWTQGTYYIASIDGTAAVLDRSPAAVGTINGSFNLGGNRTVQVQYDGGSLAATLTVSHAGQSELPYAIASPVVCHEMRLVPTDTNTVQLFGVTWLWLEYPEYLATVPDYAVEKWPSGKYVRGVVLEGDTQGTACSIQVQYDGTVQSTLTVTQTGKTISTYAFSTPFLANEVRLVPLGRWRRFSVRWIYDEYPDFAALITPWTDDGIKNPKYLRGCVIQADTNNQSVTLTLHLDGAATAQTFALQSNGQKETFFPISPVAAYMMRWSPNNPWRFFACKWIYDVYADLGAMTTAWEDAGSLVTKFLRGGIIETDTNNATFAVTLQTDLGTSQVMNVTANGKIGFAFALSPQLTAHLMRWIPGGSWRYFRTHWIYDEYPEIKTIVTPWINCGYEGAKYVQGLVLPADTNGVATDFQIQYDGGVLATTITGTHTGKQSVAYSFTPFVAHNLRIVPQAVARIWDKEIKWIWEPCPEQATTWKTPAITAGFSGYWHARDGWIAHESTANITMTVTVDGTAYNYTLAHGGGAYLKTYLPFQPAKGKSCVFTFTSAAGFRLYAQDSTIRAREWGAVGPYQTLHVFGDSSVIDGAKI